jgi:hypothetical protein
MFVRLRQQHLYQGKRLGDDPVITPRLISRWHSRQYLSPPSMNLWRDFDEAAQASAIPSGVCTARRRSLMTSRRLFKHYPPSAKTAQRETPEFPAIPLAHHIVMATKAVCARTESSAGVSHCSRLIEPFPSTHIGSVELRPALLVNQ